VIVLGLDTATTATVAGVLRADGSVVEVRDDPAPGVRPGHANRLLAAAEEALERAGVGWDEVERLAVGVGPGSFTGLRIGIATARALAQARDLPLVGVSSLEALAHGAVGDHVVLAVLDARRGEVFAAAWRGDERLVEPVAIAPAALAESLLAGTLAVGDGAVRFREQLERAGAGVPADSSAIHRVSALQVCRLGWGGEHVDRDALVPDYRREPDASPRSP